MRMDYFYGDGYGIVKRVPPRPFAIPNQNTGKLDYFDVLTNIIELSYSNGNNVILF